MDGLYEERGRENAFCQISVYNFAGCTGYRETIKIPHVDNNTVHERLGWSLEYEAER
jgi:hypothetical protein